jgi:LruC domain-containing protein
MKILNLFGLLAVGIVISTSCSKQLPQLEENPDGTSNNAVTMKDVKASESFNWETSAVSNIHIATLDRQNQAVAGVKVSVYTDFKENGGSAIINGITNEDGIFELDYRIPNHLTEVVIATDHIGFVNEAKVPVQNGQVMFTFGGTPTSFASQLFTPAPQSAALKNQNNTNITINLMGTYNSVGVPNYLEPVGDYITPAMMADINNALPENRPVPTYHPEYLYDVNRQNLTLTEDADVWITFVSEGAGYRNVLAYYTYHRDFPPQTTADVESCTVVFPNVSFNGSGGGLTPGDKVFIGNFEAGTVIAWILMRNGWNQTSQTATTGLGLLYSDKSLNPESNPTYKQHVVLLEDAENDRFVVSFEDLIRPGGDNDFNDAIFFATVDPIEAVETDGFPPLDPTPTDTDGDGVSDDIDEYPTDPELAFNNYYSSENHYGTLAFEDLWPSTGDYDFNDLVIDYNFNRVTNAQNKVVKLISKFVVRAIGASFHNGFGFEMEGISPSQIAYVNGQNLLHGIVTVNSNGTEAGQSNATIIVFDDAWDHGHGNTRTDRDFIVPDTMTLELKLTSPMTVGNFGLAPFNPFIFVNGNRGREVHLADYNPTDLADYGFFGTNDDTSLPVSGRFYKTENNLPFGLNIVSKFDYPIEKAPINSAHLKFIPWVESNGELFEDWYMDNANYRNNDFIYHIE